MRIKVEDEISKVFYPFNPLDVVGWKGDLTVWKINMRDIRPVMSHRAHLPPSAHTTFVTGGAVVCSFLPRPLSRIRMRCACRSSIATPTTTSSSSITTAISSARTTSSRAWRRCIRAASTTGRIPRRWRIRGRRRTPTNSAVMLDGLNPIHVLPAGEQVEWKEYWMSWMAPETAAAEVIVDPQSHSRVQHLQADGGGDRAPAHRFRLYTERRRASATWRRSASSPRSAPIRPWSVSRP